MLETATEFVARLFKLDRWLRIQPPQDQSLWLIGQITDRDRRIRLAVAENTLHMIYDERMALVNEIRRELRVPVPAERKGDAVCGMLEMDNAIMLANRVLDRVNADPDDDMAVLSRQLLRALERNGGTGKQRADGKK